MLDEEISAALALGGGVVGFRPAWRSTLSRAVSRGDLRRLLPGVYCCPGGETDLRVRLRGLALSDPDAVLVERAAAAVSWWPGLAVPIVVAARRSSCHPAAPGFAWVQRALPPEHVIDLGGLRLTAPALTVLDLVDEFEGVAIDEALRRRAVSLPELHVALAASGRRRGNDRRRALLQDSRDAPWSEAERRFHRLLRDLRLPWRYRTNFPVRLAHGPAYLDVALPELRLGWEVDGHAFHCSATAFVADRVRDVDAGLAGWRLHRFAAQTIDAEPGWVAEAVRRLVRSRAAELGLDPSGRAA